MLFHRETIVVLPETWKKENLNKYDYIFSYNEKFLHSLVDQKKIVKVLMPRNLSFDSKLFYAKKSRKFSMVLRNKVYSSNQDLIDERNNVVSFSKKTFQMILICMVLIGINILFINII